MKILTFLLAGISALLTLLFDFLFHYFFTTEMETPAYFVVKFLLAYVLSFIALYKFSFIKASIVTLIFTGIFATYYRLTEYLYDTTYGSRVPTIQILTTTIEFFEHKYISILIWFIVHAGAFLLPVVAIGYLKEYFD